MKIVIHYCIQCQEANEILDMNKQEKLRNLRPPETFFKEIIAKYFYLIRYSAVLSVSRGTLQIKYIITMAINVATEFLELDEQLLFEV